jgi:hypothetical protein
MSFAFRAFGLIGHVVSFGLGVATPLTEDGRTEDFQHQSAYRCIQESGNIADARECNHSSDAAISRLWVFTQPP